ncbi:MAG: protein-L-isoaspartate(D-aspartate) O-methyltransferase [Woeseiaceae bacterium]|jgi:protein-L-isoaspartate(D-aspartate) O-methyltransferase|nr:protein-L-isoaspartate(D-aspartate) O-methyltransferase [Woeseiaceae bacterium]
MMIDYARSRERMVANDIAIRGIHSSKVLDAMRKVPRERFVPRGEEELAYEDFPLPIGEGQTISQPFIVAYMIDALGLEGGEKVLEIGGGSGYAAAVLAEIAGSVFTIERIAGLADRARKTLAALGYDNVTVRHGDGAKGLPEEGPFDAIVVAAGAPDVPEALKAQLAIGGHLVIPVGGTTTYQELIRITRVSEDDYRQEDLVPVRFVPLVSEHGWPDEDSMERRPAARPARISDEDLLPRIADASEPFQSIDTADLEPLLERIGDAGVVLIGEASHGTSEFYRMRDRITRALIEQKGFRFVAIEGDWPDAARIDHYVRHFEYPPTEWTAFARFPTWMWRNQEVRTFVDWLREHNTHLPDDRRVAFHGLDLYSMYSSIRAVLRYLDDVDPETAALARERYACLTPWQPDPATYGRMATSGTLSDCESEVLQILLELHRKHTEYAEKDGERFLDAVQNARLVANAERYYRRMYQGSHESWNLRDTYMFETLNTLRHYYAEAGADAKAIVWAHNSHVGDATATEMSARGETNLGKLARAEWGDDVYIIGFGTDSGTVAAASDWDGPMQVKTVLPGRTDSYEGLFHNVGLPGFLLGLKDLKSDVLRWNLAQRRLQRAIGVIYRPETERTSHYFGASLPQQFDEYIWIDRTSAVTPFDTTELEDFPDTYPFGL